MFDLCNPPLAYCSCMQVRGGRGLQRTNRDLVDGLFFALYHRLRWSSRTEDVANLAVYLLQVPLILALVPGFP